MTRLPGSVRLLWERLLQISAQTSCRTRRIECRSQSIRCSV